LVDCLTLVDTYKWSVIACIEHMLKGSCNHNTYY